MTMPRERTITLINVKGFLRRLLDPKETPRVPKQIRRQAYYLLKHYPEDYNINKLCDLMPTVFGDANER